MSDAVEPEPDDDAEGLPLTRLSVVGGPDREASMKPGVHVRATLRLSVARILPPFRPPADPSQP